jgi:predicted ATPase
MLSDIMPTEPIERLIIKNYGCIKDVEIRLTRLHAFIGPNDSGKSTILRFIREDIKRSQGQIPLLLHLTPSDLRAPTYLIPDGETAQFQNDHGRGLPSVYDTIASRDIEGFLRIQSDMRELFPTMKKLQLRNPSNSTKALAIELEDGTQVPAEQMSEGMLYYLAFAALSHIEPTSVLLVEEPENGLHPARIADVMRILREISQETQVLIATHSPLVVNELEPDEVSVVTRRPGEGTKVTPIRQTPNFEERSKIYALGELWLSYADGTYEEPLLEGPRLES